MPRDFFAYGEAALIGTSAASAAPETKTWQFDRKTLKTEKTVKIEVTQDGYIGELEIALPFENYSDGNFVGKKDEQLSVSVSVINPNDYSYEGGKPYGPLKFRVTNDPGGKWLLRSNGSYEYFQEGGYFISDQYPVFDSGGYVSGFNAADESVAFSASGIGSLGPCFYRNYAIYTGTPSDSEANDGEWDGNRLTWVCMFLTQEHVDTFLATGKLDGYDWPGLKELLMENGIGSQMLLAAKPTAATVLVNGKKVDFDAYNIHGSNYFKLRDIAYALNGTEKQFEISYDPADKGIELTLYAPYTAVGGEMASKGAGGDKTPIRTYVPVGVTQISSGGGTHGSGARLPMYNIDGNNYMKLREIASRINFGVTWNADSQTIRIDTSVGYTPE